MGGAWEEFEKSSSSNTGTLFVVGAVAALGFLAFLHFYGDSHRGLPGGSKTESVTVNTRADPEVTFRLEDGSDRSAVPSNRDAVTSTPPDATVVGVYECNVKGQRVISDRPCGAGAQARVLVVEHPDPQDAALAQQRLWQAQQSVQRPVAQSSAAPSAQSGAQSSVAGSTGNETACASVDQAIEQLNARMRQGYGSQEGEWLRAEWHRLHEQRDALKCGR